jgi:hypothetical protein
MTQSEKDTRIYEQKAAIEQIFKDIQMQAGALKNPDDETKMNQLMQKIKDDIADVTRMYGYLHDTEEEEVETEQYDYNGDVLGSSMTSYRDFQKMQRFG